MIAVCFERQLEFRLSDKSSVKAIAGLGDENGELGSLQKSSQKNEFILPF